jgi:hypothetical protein
MDTDELPTAPSLDQVWTAADELLTATVNFLESLRVMVAKTFAGGPGGVVTIRPSSGDDEDDAGDPDDWEGRDLTARDVCEHVRLTLGWPEKEMKVRWQGRLLRDRERLYAAGVRSASTIHVVDAAACREEGELPGGVSPIVGAELGEVSPMRRRFPVETAEEVLAAPNPYAPAHEPEDDLWRDRLVCTAQGVVRY